MRSNVGATDVIRRWRADLTSYARDNLKVLTKGGELVPFIPNTAQRALEAAVYQAMKVRGRARLVVVKGRQLGISTVVAALFIRDAMLKGGTRVSVIAHRKDATSNLAEMTRRFYDETPACAQVKLVKRNDTELIFRHQSSYTLSTAGQAASPGSTGRSRTATHLHASEFAFWVGAGDRIAGLGQALADEERTIGIVESTAQGQANALFDLWRMAEAEVTDWRPLFLPWFIEPSYQREPPPGWQPSKEMESDYVPSEFEYGELYDLTRSQLYWRRLKIHELSLGQGSGLLRWCQEYPATAEEAFLSTSEKAFMNAHHIADARARDIPMVAVNRAPLVIGIDPATSHGTDLTCFIRRRRRKAYGLEAYARMESDEIVSRAWTMWKEERPETFVVDRSGVGDHVYDALTARGVPCLGVFFGGRASRRMKYYDKRAELYDRGRQWISDADVPDDTDLARDLIAQKEMPLENRSLRLVNKHQLQDMGAASPDRGDAWALTFEFVDPELGWEEHRGDRPVDVFRDVPREAVVS